MPEMNLDIVEEKIEVEQEQVCPDCGSEAVMVQGHCMTCLACGNSLCAL